MNTKTYLMSEEFSGVGSNHMFVSVGLKLTGEVYGRGPLINAYPLLKQPT